MFHSRTTDAAHKAVLSKNTHKPFRLLVERVWRCKEHGGNTRSDVSIYCWISLNCCPKFIRSLLLLHLNSVLSSNI